MRYVLFFEGFSCSMEVLYGGIWIRKFDQKISAVFFLQFLVTKTVDLDPNSLEILDPISIKDVIYLS